MRKYILWLCVLCIPTVSGARQYPLQQVTINNCISPAEEPCTFAIPHITGANYTIADSPRYRRIYKVLWWATDTDGRDVSVGGHKWVDIASVAGTPVYAMWSGVVIEAGRKGERGNLIVIEHTIGTKKIRSSYAHLDEVLVRKWDTVAEGDQIGEIGKSGNASGPHLHRQIDINQTGVHPYHPSNCGDDLEAIINEWKCRSAITTNTVDPILFLETQGTSLGRDNSAHIASAHTTQTAVSLTGFVWGYIPYNSTKILKILPQSDGDITTPIVIKSMRWYTDIFPDQVLFLWTQRSVFVSAQHTGLDIIQVMQWDTILQTLPIIVGMDRSFTVSNDTIVSLRRSFTHY